MEDFKKQLEKKINELYNKGQLSIDAYVELIQMCEWK